MKKYTKQTTKPTTTHSGEGKISIAAHNFHSPSSYSFTCMNQDNTWLKSHKIPQDLQNTLRVTTQLNPILQSYCSNSHLHVKCALELFPVAEEKPSIQQRYWANKSVQSPRAECPWASPRGQILLTGAVTSQLRLILHQTPLAHMEPSWLTGPKIYTPAWGAELSDCHTGHRGHSSSSGEKSVQSSACTSISFLCWHATENNRRGEKNSITWDMMQKDRICSLRK